MKILNRIISLAAVLALAVPGLSSAAETITGHVKAVGPGGLISLHTPDSDEPPVHYHYGSEVAWVDTEGKLLTAADIRPGDVVTIVYEDTGKRRIAQRVIVTESAPVAATRVVDRKVTVKTTGNGLAATETVTTATTSYSGPIVRFDPGKSIVIATEGAEVEPIVYEIHEDVIYVSTDDEPVEVTALRPGTPVTVYYDASDDDRRLVKRVVIREEQTTTTTTTTNETAIVPVPVRSVPVPVPVPVPSRN